MKPSLLERNYESYRDIDQELFDTIEQQFNALVGVESNEMKLAPVLVAIDGLDDKKVEKKLEDLVDDIVDELNDDPDSPETQEALKSSEMKYFLRPQTDSP